MRLRVALLLGLLCVGRIQGFRSVHLVRHGLRPCTLQRWREPVRSTPWAPLTGAGAGARAAPEGSEEPLGAGAASGSPAGLTDDDRKIIGTLAGLGVLETGYINAFKAGLLGSGAPLCAGMSCSEVLNGPWSSVFGVPLTVPGMAAYATAALLALAPLVVSRGNMPTRIATQKGLIAVTSAMATFSTYLMLVLFLKLGSWCPWCFFSACLSTLLATFTWFRTGVKDSWRVGLVSAGATAVLSAALFVVTSTDVALAEARGYLDERAQDILYTPPPITRHSSERALSVAKALEAKGAKMYGAYWCSHCFDQKQSLGMEAMGRIPYVECAKDGVNSQTKLCRENKIPGYPTWVIGGKQHPGEMTLSELEEFAMEKGE